MKPGQIVCARCGGHWTSVDRMLVFATAMSLYRYNVSKLERATLLAPHSGHGLGTQLMHLVELSHWATAMPAPTAHWYARQAMNRYGEEAEDRIIVNLAGYQDCATHGLGKTQEWDAAGGCPECRAAIEGGH